MSSDSDAVQSAASDPSLQIHQDSKGDGNQMIGQVLGGMVIYGQVTFHSPPPDLDSSAPKAKTLDIGANPYKGLLAFQETDGDRFFGRELEIDQLWEKFRSLHEQADAVRILPIYGPSGSGKSSLARAGLIPELARRPLPGSDRARVAVLVPSNRPLEALAMVLARVATNDPVPAEKSEEFERLLKRQSEAGEYEGLRRIANALPEIAFKPLIVLVDQLEEVFTLCEDPGEREAFIGNLLCAAAESSNRVSAIVTLRSDFLGATQKHPRLNQLIASQGVFVAAMSVEGLREAITKPAELAGHPLDLGTIDRLIEQTEEREGALPLLQFALTRIWQGLAEGQEPAETLRAIGGVGGALAGEAQRIYDTLNPDDQEIARRVFLGLVQLGEGSKDTRRRTELERIISHRDSLEQVQKVIARFSAPGVRLITLSDNAGTETAEVTHEALFDHWQQMKVWLDGSRSDLRFQRRLDEAATLWDESGRPEGNLWRSPDLDVLRQYHERASNDMTPLQVEFFKAAIAATEKAVKEKKRQRQLLVMVLSTGLVATSSAALFSAIKVRESEIGQIQTSVALSVAKLANNQDLEASVESIRAGKALQRSFFQAILPDPQLQPSVLRQLQETANTGQEQNRLDRHQGSVRSVVFSPDGKQLATSGADSTVRLWNLSGKQLAELKAPQGSVWSVVFSPDGKQLATSGGDSTVRLWNLSGKQLAELKGHQGGVNSVVFSPDGKQLATSGDDGTARLWNLSGKQLAELKAPQGGVNSVVFSPDGKQLATSGGDGTARLWNLSGRQLAELKGHQESVNSVVFSPDGKQLATSGDDGTARLWNLSGKQLAELKGHQGSVNSVVFSPDGKQLATSGDDGTARLWNLSGKQLADLKAPQGGVWSVVFSPDGKQLATRGEDGIVRLWDSSGKQLADLKAPQGSVWSVVFSPDGKQLATSGDDGTARLWNLSGKQLAELKAPQGSVWSVVFSPDGKQLATSGDDGIVRLWDSSGKQLAELKGHQGNVLSVVFSPDGKQLATSGADSTARLWNLSGKQLAELKGHQGSVNSVVFSPDGKQLATSGADGTVRLWNLSGKQLAELKGHQGVVLSVVFSPDGKQLATSGADGTARLWNLSGKQLAELKVPQGGVWSVVFSPDGKQLATRGEDGIVRLWDSSGKQLAELKAPQGSVNSVVFSPDGKQLATHVEDGTARLWDSSGKQLAELKAPQGSVNSVVFSPDGKLATSGADGTTRLWNLSGKQLAELKGHQGIVWSVVFSPDGKQLATLGDDGTARLWQVGGIEELLSKECNWVRDYLKNNPTVAERDRHLCED